MTGLLHVMFMLLLMYHSYQCVSLFPAMWKKALPLLACAEHTANLPTKIIPTKIR